MPPSFACPSPPPSRTTPALSSRLLRRPLQLATTNCLVGSKICIQSLRNLGFAPFAGKVAANSHRFDLGCGHVPELLLTPSLHRPA